MITAKDVLRELNERLNTGLIENHPEWAEIIKEIITNAKEKVESLYETGERDVEEIEHISRDGFISENDGGYIYNSFTDIYSLKGSGRDYNLPKKAQEVIDKLYEENLNNALESFKEKYAKEIKDIPEDKLNYNDLYDLGFSNLAEKLDEYEREYNSDDYAGIMIELRCMFDDPDTMYISSAVNWEAPYHRSGSGNEVSKEITIEFKDAKELKNKAEKAMKECLNFIGVK